MRSMRILGLLVAVLVALALIVACSPPGAKTGQSAGGGGRESPAGHSAGQRGRVQGQAAEARPQGRDRRLLAVGEGGQPLPHRRDTVHQGRGREAGREEAADHQRSVAAVQADQRHPGHARPGRPVLIVAPLNSDGLEPALQAAAAKKVPVLTIDRKVNAGPCKDYLAFLGSNFVEQGKRAADAMIKVTGGTGKFAILLGSSGNNVTTDRTNGFVDQIKAKAPGLEIVAQQTGEFARDKGQAVMEQLISSHPGITAVYAENDEMALGAVTALKTAGKNPGKDVKIVSIDGTRNAVQAIVDGTSTRSSNPTRASGRWPSRPRRSSTRAWPSRPTSSSPTANTMRPRAKDCLASTY